MKDWIKNNYKKLIIGAVIIMVLSAAFLVGGQIEPNNNVPVASETSERSNIAVHSRSSDNEMKEEISENTSAVPSEKTSESTSAAESLKSISEISKESSISSKSESADIKLSSSIENTDQSSISDSETARPSNDKPKETATEKNSKSENTNNPTPSKTSSKSQQSGTAETNTKTSIPTKQQIQQNDTTNQPTEKLTDKQESSKPVVISEPSTENEQGDLSCTLTISCATAVNNSSLSRAKRSVLPSDGMILNHAKVYFNEGASAYDVISKACKENNIHFDAVTTPLTGGRYIKGINNLYEFDCGNVSGWMYRVNGEFPNIGCSEYYLCDGDEVSFLYSCNLGGDIGNIYKGE